MKKHSHAHPHPTQGLKEAIRKIESSDFRLTGPRRLLLEAIFAQKEPFTASSLEDWLKRKGRKERCDAVTIYRTLPVFEELGLIGRCDFTSEKTHYEVTLHHAGHHHHHFLCLSCRKVEPLEFCVADSQEHFLKRLGYTALTHRLEFTGKCPSCSRKAG